MIVQLRILKNVKKSLKIKTKLVIFKCLLSILLSVINLAFFSSISKQSLKHTHIPWMYAEVQTSPRLITKEEFYVINLTLSF